MIFNDGAIQSYGIRREKSRRKVLFNREKVHSNLS
jgi:hypothetical protein